MVASYPLMVQLMGEVQSKRSKGGCLWAAWLCELKGSFMVLDAFISDFQA